jgi:hypothetical protein
MILFVNDDFADRELAIEDLEAIAAGSLLDRAWSWFKDETAVTRWVETVRPHDPLPRFSQHPIKVM